MTTLLDIILVFVAVEAGVLIWLRSSRGEASALAQDLANLGSGFCLLLAVRLAWTNAPAVLVLLLVTLAGAAHVFDMLKRFGATRSAQKKAPHSGAPVSSSEPDQPF